MESATALAMFSGASYFSEADYLTFLRRRVPDTLEIELEYDGQPELGLTHDFGGVKSFMWPLAAGCFPAENLFVTASILESQLIRYDIELAEDLHVHDPYKLIYCVSLYLHCFLKNHGQPTHGAYLTSLNILVKVCPTVDFESRLQVCHFLAALVPTIMLEAIDEPAATTSGAIIVLATILASVINDLSLTAQHKMKEERIARAWGMKMTSYRSRRGNGSLH
jgi:hypothetical protein